MDSFLFLFLAGLLGGFIAGLVGIGGGIIYVFIIPPALRHLGIPEDELVQYTIANSIFAILFASLSANYMLIRKNDFYIKETLLIGIPAALAAPLTLIFVVNTPFYSIRTFNVVVVMLLIYLLYRTLIGARKAYSDEVEVSKVTYGMVGTSAGIVASLSGLGGGIVVISVLNSFLKVGIKKASNISSGVIMVSSLGMTIFSLFESPLHQYSLYSIGYIILPVSLALAAGVIIASPFGVRASRILSSRNISYIYAGFLMFVIIKKIAELMI